jgi:hypothetical protein
VTLHPMDSTRREERDPLALELVRTRSGRFAPVQAACTEQRAPEKREIEKAPASKAGASLYICRG